MVVGSAAGTLEAVALASTLRARCRRHRFPPSRRRIVPRASSAALRTTVPGIRVLVLNWEDAVGASPEPQGADAYIRKTFRPHELIDAVISAAAVSAA